MTQQIHTAGGHLQHTIWQDGKMPEPCVIVIFGATGDLTQRKLLPTLAHLMHDHPLPESSTTAKDIISSPIYLKDLTMSRVQAGTASFTWLLRPLPTPRSFTSLAAQGLPGHRTSTGTRIPGRV